MSDEELISLVEQADRTMTPGEWLYRPEQYDDWGAIRLANPSAEMAELGFRYGSHIAAVSVSRLNNYELQQHRTAGTDPCEGDGKGIAALRNNAAAIAQALRRLTQERDAARAAMEPKAVLRSLASYVGNGGYNADSVDPAEFERKIREGIDTMVRVERERREKAERERDEHAKRGVEARMQAEAERDALRERCAELEKKLTKAEEDVLIDLTRTKEV